MSATNVSGDVGATSSTGASARSEDVGPFAARSGQSVEQQPRHSSDGTMSFADHLLHSENQGSGSSRAQVTEDDAGDEEDVTVDAPMLSSGLATCSYVELAPESVPANSGGRECEKKADINHDVNSLDCANLVDASSNVDGTTRPGGPQTAAVQIPETTTGNTDTATSGLPALADEANAADCLVSGDESRPSTRQQSSPTTTAVPELPVSQLQNQSTTSFSTVPPVPPKIPEQEITTEIKQEKAGSRGSIQSSITVPHLSATEQEDQTNQQHQQQQQTRTPVRPAVIKEDAKELKDKSSYILSSFKKLRRSNSRREITKSTKLAPEEARPTLISPQQSTASSHSLSTANAGPQMTSDQWQETQHAAAFPTHTGTQVLHSWETVLPPPPPPIQLSSDQDWSEDGLGVPASLRPGRDVSVERYEYQFAQHQSQYQRREQHQSSHAYAPYIHHSPKEAPQRAPLHQYSHQEAAHEQHSQRIPCDECQEHFEEAWAQSESHRHALTRQLAAAREQSARQIALLHDRDAEFADLSSLVERLRTRIQEQVRQLEQMPAAFTGKNTVSGLAGYAAGGVGLLPDGQIRDRWKNLQWQIRQCVDARLAALPSSTTLGPVRPEQVPFLRRLTPDYGKFLRSRQGSASLVEAAVWTMLADNIFSGARRTSRMCWAAPWSTHLVKMSSFISLFCMPRFCEYSILNITRRRPLAALDPERSGFSPLARTNCHLSAQRKRKNGRPAAAVNCRLRNRCCCPPARN